MKLTHSNGSTQITSPDCKTLVSLALGICQIVRDAWGSLQPHTVFLGHQDELLTPKAESDDYLVGFSPNGKWLVVYCCSTRMVTHIPLTRHRPQSDEIIRFQSPMGARGITISDCGKIFGVTNDRGANHFFGISHTGQLNPRPLDQRMMGRFFGPLQLRRGTNVIPEPQPQPHITAFRQYLPSQQLAAV